MTLSTAAAIAATLATRAAGITKVAGYETDIGLKVFRGKRKVDDNEVGTGCVSLIEGVDKVAGELGGRVAQVHLNQRYGLVAYIPCDPDNPNDAAHAAIRDLKRAVFAGNATLDGAVRKVAYRGRDIGPRMDGVAIVVAVVEIAVEYVESLSAP